MSGAGGVLIVTTKQGKGLQIKDIHSSSVLPLKVEGFYKAREFYAPVYYNDNNTKRIDVRSTIYWVSEIVTDEKGNATLTFYNSDNNGKMQVRLERMHSDGDTGIAGLSYLVK